MKKSIIIILLVLIADQALKIWVKLNMTLGEEIPMIGNWFNLYFTENNGMAFGLQFGGEFGKLFLSVFRILAIIAIAFYLYMLSKRTKRTGLMISISLIFAGALGNMIDSAFYGMFFTQSSYHSLGIIASEGQGYSSFLHGRVVDMLYFPIINFTQANAPTWLPSWIYGSDGHFIFFRPIFNLADSSITIGVFWLLLFERKYLSL
ncbi:MAG: lipoprotein signal peptidase [Lentimicrobiaceae bacterium]|nr:lipoprotein signal peptidase [Lentimicrobiaceae bacterium]MBT3454488.1 lipoprotein signal peptidase [Lentimicrobiaceae bacterium]MBT3819268.1 lipoprotein signal peptidase [Lentimicrobiaceae bacterium]MBT4061048.1 lipoprotein signal peptidase [Lentimicrobiaceae bacterium]MBT4189995.1 lipoprotein signal peptidase [Lentimicrobiaceae bacterium]